ncbi:hypothetical protein [Actinokineospora globicatena]|uniref:hypothetical protein n=1 Tax=Actinokineospora globicatena TaxID=103729 RepID=UPI0020A4B94C|nr:hypothetical protein [Actinokineospora globicatena]MCP2303694.1 hypothetical protein [Actinokineospora globicatena]GLW79168.1 hypothetical protein Aglo01_36500 [Actinokineospora globicatena]GLW86422.1 hypothetical protein Aglo02_40610 [Actinokineospora globicatena]
MPRTAQRSPLTAVAANVIPAYAMPALMSYASALAISDPRLAAASVTTIAIPSALAALAVTFGPRGGRRTVRAIVGAGVCAALAFAASIVLVHFGLFDSTLFLDAVPSAALGGAITAARFPNRKKDS